MMQDNDSFPFEKYGSFCSKCKLVLNSVYSIGSASSINEYESITDKGLKDQSKKKSILNERVESWNEDLINKNDERCNNSYNELPSLKSYVKYKDSVKSEDEIQVILHKKTKEVKKIDKKLNIFNEIYVPNDYKRYLTRVKPAIIEDKILQSSEKLKISNLKKQKLQISNYKRDHSKCSTSYESIKYVDKICEDITNDTRNLKNVRGIEKQNEQLTEITCSIYSKSQNRKNEAHVAPASNHFLQYNTLRNTILNRRKRISNIAKNLLTLSTYLNGICKTILEAEDSNPRSVHSNISFNLSKKVNKGTSPILFSKTCQKVTDFATDQENSHDMYRYNPYRSRNIMQKKV